MGGAPLVIDDRYRRYAALLLRQHQLLLAGREDDPELEDTEEELGLVWDGLDAMQRRSLSGLGSDLSWVRRGGEPAPRGRTIGEVASQDYQDLARARNAGDWHAVLHSLRVCSPGVPLQQAASLRAAAWTELGFPDLASVFESMAAELGCGAARD